MPSPRTATTATLASLALAALLNVEALTATVALQPETRQQQWMMGVLRPVEAAAHAGGLTRPRRWLRSAVGREELQSLPSGGEDFEEARSVESPEENDDTGAAYASQQNAAEWDPSVPPPEPSPPFPLEVWVIGDSLINMGGPRLATLLEAELQAQVWVDSRPNTGLVRPDYYDWPAALRARLVSEPAPDVVVVLMGANDGQNIRVDGVRTERWTDPWRAEYARRAGAVMDLLGDAGARVAWLGLPGMRRRSHQRTADQLNALLSEEASRREHVVHLPLEPRFTYQGKRFSVHLERADGQRFTARAGDGVHFTWSGRKAADHVSHPYRPRPDWFEAAPSVVALDEHAP